MVDLKKILNLEDANFINQSATINWVPKDPRDVLLPYFTVAENTEEELEVDKQRKKTKEVIDGYSKIIENCKNIEAQIEEQCKDVKVPLTRSKHLDTIEAIARIFGLGELEEITFEMYKVCIRELAKIGNNTGAP
jgi:hypothetical protein